MRSAILSWYAYSESGSARAIDRESVDRQTSGTRSLDLSLRKMNRWFDPTNGPGEIGAGEGGADEFGAPEGGLAAMAAAEVASAATGGKPTDLVGVEIGLAGPAGVADLFADVRRLDAEVDALGWQHLFSRYGLDGLIDMAKRRGGWPDPTADEAVAEAVVGEALDAGYDPVSGLTGAVRRETGRFEPTEAEYDAGEVGPSRN